MTNVRRPINLHLQRSATAMVSSSSGPSPFGATSDSGGGRTSGAGRGGEADAQQTPPQPAPRSTPIRPNALINFNCLAQTPTVPTNPTLSPMQTLIMMPRSNTSTNQRPTCWSSSLPTGAESTNAATATSTATTTTTTSTTATFNNYSHHQSKALSPSSLNDSQPSLIMPHLFVGNQDQTNRETINKLNIKYILSLGLLPMIITNAGSSVVALSPASPSAITKKAPPRQATAKDNHHTHHNHHHNQSQNLMPVQNSSKDFKIRIRSNTPTTPTSPFPNQTSQAQQTTATNPIATASNPTSSQSKATQLAPAAAAATTTTTTKPRDENKGIKQVRSVYCKCINIADNSDQMLSKFFDEAFVFIEEARKKKCNILIHCLAGISRSPTIAIAYLMRVRSLHWKDAYDLVKQCRPQIDPNLSFMGQLRIYNKSLRDDHSAELAKKRIGSSNDKIGSDSCCHTAIKNGKTVCCIEHNKKGSGCSNGGIILGHQSFVATSHSIPRDMDSILELP